MHLAVGAVWTLFPWTLKVSSCTAFKFSHLRKAPPTILFKIAAPTPAVLFSDPFLVFFPITLGPLLTALPFFKNSPDDSYL